MVLSYQEAIEQINKRKDAKRVGPCVLGGLISSLFSVSIDLRPKITKLYFFRVRARDEKKGIAPL